MRETEVLIATIAFKDRLDDSLRYGWGVVEKVDALLRPEHFPELQEESLKVRIRQSTIEEYLLDKKQIPLAVIPECQQLVWDTEGSLEDKWKRQEGYEQRATRAEKEVRWYVAQRDGRSVFDVRASPEFIREYCGAHGLDEKMEQQIREIILSN
jgi:hypothetical protein